MKLKKFFAGVVAAAMMLTMGATAAFADTAKDPEKVTEGKFSISKTFTSVDGAYAPAETFKLVQVSKSGAQMSDSYKGQIPDLKTTGEKATIDDVEYNVVSSVSFDEENATTKNSAKNFEIGLNDYSGVGVFTYTLKEVASTDAGVVNDNRTFVVTVYATQGNDGIETKVTVHDAAAANKKLKIDDIENKFQASSLTVKKIVNGQLGDKQHDFGFTVTLSSDKPVNATLYLKKTGDNAMVASNIAFNEKNSEGKYVATVPVFTLKDGEEYTISNIPYGVTYTVNENGENNKELTVNGVDYTVSYDDDSNSTIGATAANVTVTNSTDDAIIDTGVILDNAPYIALLAIVAFGGVALILNKRRRDEE